MALGGLGAAGLASRSAAQPARPERPRVVLAVGGKTNLYNLPVSIAEQLGFFKDEGLDAEVQDHAGGGLALQSVQRGTADVAAGAYEQTILLRQQGQAYRAFVCLGRAPQMVFGVSTRMIPEYRVLAQLKGRRIGISVPQSATYTFAVQVLARAGLTPADVNFVTIGNTIAAVNAVREGQVDAIANVDPVISLLEFRNEIRVVADTRSLLGTQDFYGGPVLGGCLFAPQDYVLRYPQTVQALTYAVVRALKWLQTAGPTDLVRALPEAYMYGDRAVYLAAVAKAREALSPDGLLSDEGVAATHRAVAQLLAGQTAVRPALPQATFTNEFARRAKARYQA